MSYLTETKKRNLTEKQQLFLDNIVTSEGDFKKSAELAGYSGNHYQILKSLKQEVVDLASDVLARSAPQASQKLAAAQTILDRVGVSKTDRVEVNHNVQGGIFVLPAKDEVIIENTDYEDISNGDD